MSVLKIRDVNGNFISIRTIKGDKGTTGADGREVELQKNDTYIQWRYVGDTDWNNLIPISDLKGDQGEQGIQGIQGIQGVAGENGKEIELQATTTYIQWRYVGETTWNDLLPLSSIKGDKGDSALTFSVGTTTTGTEANVVNSGTDTDIVLDFTLPKQESKTIVQGTSISINNANGSYNAINFEIEGKSEQETRSGNQLLNIPNGTYGGITYYVDKEGYFNFSGTATSDRITITLPETSLNGTYTFVVRGMNGYNRPTALKDNTTYHENIFLISASENMQTKTINTVAQQLVIYLVNGTTYNEKYKIMLSSGDEEKNIEPYGVMPSPDYPSEIKTVKGIRNLFDIADGEYTGVNNLTVNKNKGSFDDVTGAQSINISVNFTLKSGTYTLTNGGYKYPYITLKSGSTNIAQNGSSDNGIKTFTVTSDTLIDSIIVYQSTYTGYSKDFIFGLYEGNEVKNFVPYGSWLQVKDTGKNLLKLIDGTYTSNGVTAVVENGIITLNGTATANSFVAIPFKYTLLANKEYTLSANNKSISDSKNGIRFMGETATLANFGSVDAKKVIKYTANKKITDFTIRTESGTTYNNFIIKPQFEKGPTATEYEPYKETSILIDMNKPNLFDKDNANILNALLASNGTLVSGNQERTLYIRCLPNTTYTISKIAGKRLRVDERETIPTIGSSNINLKFNDTSTSLTYTTSSSGNYLLVSYLYTGADTLTEEEIRNSIKIYEGIGIDDYYELCSKGDAKDVLTIQNRQTNINQKIGKIVLDGSESGWSKDTSTGAYRLQLNGIVGTWSKKLEISTHWICDNTKAYNNNNGYFAISSSGLLWVGSEQSTLTAFKTWLSNNPVTVYYLLAEPQTITLNGSYDIELFEGINNITNNDELQPNMIIEYWNNFKGNKGIDGNGILKLSSEDPTNPICLFDLEEGIYNLYGYVKYYQTYEGTAALTSPTLATVQKSSSTTYIQMLDPYGNKINGYEIMATSYKETSLSTLDKYSTEEVKTNEVSEDGRPIYRKTIILNNVNKGVTTHSHNIENFNELIDVSGSYYSSDFGYQPLLCVVPDNISTYGIGFGNFSSTTFNIILGTGRNTTNTIKIRIKYTKTTD